jgi:hypothetical protein
MPVAFAKQAKATPQVPILHPAPPREKGCHPFCCLDACISIYKIKTAKKGARAMQTENDDSERMLSSPLSVLEDCYDRWNATNGGAAADGNWGEQQVFKEALSTGLLDQIPVLTKSLVRSGKLKPNTLVRYRGMVQDMFDPEYYLGLYDKVDSTGQRKRAVAKYMDVLPDNACMDSGDSGIGATFERNPYYCVPVPGQGDWVDKELLAEKEAQEQMAVDSSAQGSKRGRGDMETDTDNVGKQAKNEKQEEDIQMADGPETTEAAGGSAQHMASESSMPGSSGEGVDCLVKVYNMEGASPIKLNQIVDFIGVYAVDPPSELDTVQAAKLCKPCGEAGAFEGVNQLEAMELEQYIARNPPSSLVPRLHCIIFEPAKELCYVSPPASLAPLVSASKTEAEASLASELRGIRQEILRFLTATLAGDELAAQYLLICMISRVVGRASDGSDPIGNFAINISNVPGVDVTRRVNEVLSLLLPRTQHIGLSIENLNKRTLLPTKDHQANRLVGSVLQLVDSTLVAIDETVMGTGMLKETGIQNLQTLQRLAMFQQVQYDFQFYQRDFSLDAPVVVLSVGKSMLTIDTQVVLRPEASTPTKAVRAWDAALDGEADENGGGAAGATDEFLNRARFYIGRVRESLVSNSTSGNQGPVAGGFEVDEQMTSQIQEAFVAARSKDSRISGDDLKRWLTMARLLTASYCQPGGLKLTAEVWKEVQDLEEKRVARLPKETKKATTPTAQQQASVGTVASA